MTLSSKANADLVPDQTVGLEDLVGEDALHAAERLTSDAVDMAPPKKVRRFAKFSSTLVLSLVVLAAIIGIWWGVVGIFHIAVAILPTPGRVAKEIVDQRGYLWHMSVPTMLEAGVGYLIAVVVAVPLGILLARPGRLGSSLNTGVLSMQIFPKVAVAPLFLIWFGYGYFPKFLFVFLLGFFPIALSASAGFRSCPQEVRDLGQVLEMGKWEYIRKLYLPGALPHIFTGMKISASFAMVAAIVYEFVGANAGLGYAIVASQANIDTPLMFAALICVTVLGFVFYGIVALIEALAIPWHVSHRNS